MAALCFFCGCAKTLPNNPLGCACRRALCDDAERDAEREMPNPESCTRKGRAEDEDDFPNDTGPLSFHKNDAHLDWSYTPQTVVLKDGDAQCFITTAQTTRGKRQHSHHLVREFRIEPSNVAKDIKHSNQELLTHPARQEIRLCEKDVRKRADKPEVSSDCSILPEKRDKQKRSANMLPSVPKSGEQYRESWRRSPGCAGQVHSIKGLSMADKPLQGSARGRNAASQTACAKMSRKNPSNKHSSSLPVLGSSCESNGSSVPEPSIKRSLGFTVAYALKLHLGATGRLLKTWN